nr:hypothetical protein [Leptolyngbyaceae cyanobacterium MO_188.B28]
PKVNTHDLSDMNRIKKGRTRHIQLKFHLQKFIDFALSLFGPFLLLFLIGILRIIPFKIAPESILNYVAIAAFIWMVTTFFTKLDPDFKEKVDLAKQVKDLTK